MKIMRRVMWMTVLSISLVACSNTEKKTPDFKTTSHAKLLLNEKYEVNHSINAENKKLLAFVIDQVKQEKWKAFRFDEVQQDWTKEVVNVSSLFEGADTQMLINPITLEEEWNIFSWKADEKDMQAIRFDQEWYFDEQAGTLKSKVIGLKLMCKHFDEQGNFIAEAPMFHVKL